MRLERRRAGGWSEADIQRHQTTMRAAFEGLAGDGYYVQVPGMFHLDMTDFPLLSPLAPRLGLTGPVGVRRVHRIVNAYSVAFFDRHLRGRPATLLDGPAEQYPQGALGDPPGATYPRRRPPTIVKPAGRPEGRIADGPAGACPQSPSVLVCLS